MPPIPFPSALYWAVDWDLPNPLEDSEEALHGILRGAREQALDELCRGFYNAVELYQAPSRTDCWVEEAPLTALALRAGQVYATLDAFSASLPLPRRMRRMTAGQAAAFSDYLCGRSLDNLEANTRPLLYALCAGCLIPDGWFPEARLKQRITHELEKTGRYTATQVTLDLRLPPGGTGWLVQATTSGLAEVRKKLAAGQPWPVRLVRSAQRFEDNPQLIAYACREEHAGRLLRFEVFEPGSLEQQHAVEVISHHGRIEVTERLGRDRRLPALGLLAEAYTPLPLPRECVPWWLRWPALRSAWLRMAAWLAMKRGAQAPR